MLSQSSTTNYVPIVNEPFLYLTGLGLSNNVSTPNSVMNIAIGQCRDSTDSFDINLNSPININILNKGAGGLDTGSITASTVYAILLISDPVNGNPTNAIFTLSPTSPAIPFGYTAYRVIGFCTTDSSSHIQKGQWTSGGTGYRKFKYDTFPATSVTSGNSTSYTPIDLSAFVPSNIPELPVDIYYLFSPAAANHTFDLQGFNRQSGGFGTHITGQVASVFVTGNTEIIAEINTSNSHPSINYRVSNNTDAVGFYVAGYTLNI